jgi:hypothetical protein
MRRAARKRRRKPRLMKLSCKTSYNLVTLLAYTVTPCDTICQHYVHPPTISEPYNPRYQTCQICNRVVCKPYCSRLLKIDVYSRNPLRIVTKTLHTNNDHQKCIAFKDITSKVYRITSVSKCCNCPTSHLTLPDSTEA